jgi:L-asparaginase II
MRNAEYQGRVVPIGRVAFTFRIPNSALRSPVERSSRLFVELYRGSVLESRHKVHVAVVDADGRLVAQAGDPAYRTFWRSAAKPFQAWPLVEDGVAPRFGLQRQDLALACASHSSEPAQVALVREFLQRIGCSERDLMCGPHRPLSEAVAKDYEKRGVRLTAVYSNCSGKHTGMLALAKHHGWPTEFYARLDHRVQQRCLKSISAHTDVPVEQIGVAVDGCGVACFALPLSNMALAYTRLAGPILEAMMLHPELVAGEGRPCTEMMRAHPGRVVVKVGAEGIYSALLTREELGVTLKVEDGNTLASALAIAAVLAELGLKPQPESLLTRPITNSRGETVGEMRVIGGLAR